VCRQDADTTAVGTTALPNQLRKNITLRIDVDKVSDEIGEAHTVTVFVGIGNTENTIFCS
jgi:hypothetical protein